MIINDLLTRYNNIIEIDSIKEFQALNRHKILYLSDKEKKKPQSLRLLKSLE